MKISHLIEVERAEGASKGDEGVRARADDTRSILELSFLHNQVCTRGIHAISRRFCVYCCESLRRGGRRGLGSSLTTRFGDLVGHTCICSRIGNLCCNARKLQWQSWRGERITGRVGEGLGDEKGCYGVVRVDPWSYAQRFSPCLRAGCW